MGVYYGNTTTPSIVTSGLTFAYDPKNTIYGNTKDAVSGATGNILASEIQFSSNSLTETMWSSVASNSGTAPSPGTGFTMSIWTRRTAQTNGDWEEVCLIEQDRRMMWFGYFINTTDRFHCSFPYFDASNNFTYWSVDPYFSDAGLTIQVGSWHNISITYNNSSRLLSTYINAKPALSGTRPSTGDLIRPINSSPNSTIRIFGGETSTSFENNRTGAVYFYNRALSLNEIKQNYASLRKMYPS